MLCYLSRTTDIYTLRLAAGPNVRPIDWGHLSNWIRIRLILLPCDGCQLTELTIVYNNITCRQDPTNRRLIQCTEITRIIYLPEDSPTRLCPTSVPYFQKHNNTHDNLPSLNSKNPSQSTRFPHSPPNARLNHISFWFNNASLSSTKNASGFCPRPQIWHLRLELIVI